MSAHKPDGGPAFPVPPDYDEAVSWATPGMSLRDWFAGQMVVLATHAAKHQEQEVTPRQFAKECYRFADAMIAERSKGREE